MQELIDEGWVVESTGGGCKAYGKTMLDGSYFLCTDEDGISLPKDPDNIVIGHYDKDGEPNAEVFIVTLAQVCEIVMMYNQIVEDVDYESEDDQQSIESEA